MGEGEGDGSDEDVEGDVIGEEAIDDDDDEEEKDDEDDENNEEEKDDEEEEGGTGSGEISVQCAWRMWLSGILTIDSFVTLSFISLNQPENVNPVLSGIGRSP